MTAKWKIASILGSYRARFGDWLDPALTDVQVVVDEEGHWLREVRSDHAARRITDNPLDMVGEFEPSWDFDEIVHFAQAFDEATLLNVATVFRSAATYEVASQAGLMEAPVRPLLTALLDGLQSEDKGEILACLRRIHMAAPDLTAGEARALVPALVARMRKPTVGGGRFRRDLGAATYDDPWDDGWLAAQALVDLNHPDAERELFAFCASLVRTIEAAVDGYRDRWGSSHSDRARLLAEWFSPSSVQRVPGPLHLPASVIAAATSSEVVRYYAERAASNSSMAAWMASHGQYTFAGSFLRIALDSLGLSIYYELYPAEANYIGKTGARGQMLHSILEGSHFFRKIIELHLDEQVCLKDAQASGKHIIKCLLWIYDATSAQVHGRPPPAGDQLTPADWEAWRNKAVATCVAMVYAAMPNLTEEQRQELESFLPQRLAALQ